MSNQFDDMSTAKLVWRYLGDLAWPREIVANDAIKTRYRGNFGDVDVFLRAETEVIFMVVSPLLKKPSDGWGECVKRLIESLRKDVKSVYIDIDQSGDIYVRVDLPSKEIQFERFAYVLISFCEISEELTLPLLQANAYDKCASEGSARLLE